MNQTAQTKATESTNFLTQLVVLNGKTPEELAVKFYHAARLSNRCLYTLRQNYFAWVKAFCAAQSKANMDEAVRSILCGRKPKKVKVKVKYPKYSFPQACKNLKTHDHYKKLGDHLSQQALRHVFHDWSSFVKSRADFKKHPEKYQAVPKPPDFKKKFMALCFLKRDLSHTWTVEGRHNRCTKYTITLKGRMEKPVTVTTTINPEWIRKIDIHPVNRNTNEAIVTYVKPPQPEKLQLEKEEKFHQDFTSLDPNMNRFAALTQEGDTLILDTQFLVDINEGWNC